MPASRLVDALFPGARVFVAGMTGESALLRDELAADPGRADGVTFIAAQYPGVDRNDYLGSHPNARQRAYFMSRAVRAAAAQGRAELLSLDYLGVVRDLQEMPPPDVAIAQLTPPDAEGWCSAGLSADFMPIVWPRARRKVAHLNPRLPRTQGSFRVHVDEIDLAVDADLPPTTYDDPQAGEVEQRIGASVAALVRDGDTLQFGIGSVPLAIGGALSHHRRLRFHGGMATGAVRTLWEAGAIDRDARLVAGVVLGTAALYDFVPRLPTLWLTDVRTTHGLQALAGVPRLIAINSAVEVDLFGQVNGERAGGVIQAGAGGLLAFAQGALASPGGRLLICLPATAKGGSVSRIVPALDANALCTVPRTLADAVVTEWGCAQLRGLSLDGRARALIDIAAPEHRAALGQAWDAIRRRA